jgi:ribose transport system permease protein
LVFAVPLVVAATVLYSHSFATAANAAAVLRNLALDGVLAVGMTLLFVGGAFDLSIGGTFSLVGVVVSWMLKTQGVPVWLAVLLGLLVGAAAGLLNGVLATKVRVNPLIATLATMGIYRGIAILIGGPSIGFLPEGFSRLAQTEFLGLQMPVWLCLFVAVVFHVLLSRSRYFRQLYYIGNNAKAAYLSGISVQRTQMAAFTIMGALAGMAGIAFASRIGTAVSTAGDGAELRVITAVILGGASLSGGRGTIVGSMAGVVFLALINNVLIIATVSSNWQSIIVGCVLVFAVATDAMLGRRQREASISA